MDRNAASWKDRCDQSQSVTGARDVSISETRSLVPAVSQEATRVARGNGVTGQVEVDAKRLEMLSLRDRQPTVRSREPRTILGRIEFAAEPSGPAALVTERREQRGGALRDREIECGWQQRD